jgi:hypothetical protein
MQCFHKCMLGVAAFVFSSAAICDPIIVTEDAKAILSPSDSVGKLAASAGGKIIRQRSVQVVADQNHLAIEELYIDPVRMMAKSLFKTVVGDQSNLTYSPSALDVVPEAGSIVNSQGVFRFDRTTGKWVLQIEKPSLSIYLNEISECFLETAPPFKTLVGIYYKQFLHYQKLALPAEASEALAKIAAIKHPGVSFSFSPTPNDEHKQEFSFYENGMIKRLEFVNNGKVTGAIENELVDSADFAIKEADMEGEFRPDQEVYNNLMMSLNASRRSGKKSLGIVFDDFARGLVVKNVFKDSPAYKGGLKPGDVIVSVLGRALTDVPKQEAIKIFGESDKVSLQIKEIDGTLRAVELKKEDESSFMDNMGGFVVAYPH